jgi:hypothetical protein
MPLGLNTSVFSDEAMSTGEAGRLEITFTDYAPDTWREGEADAR